MNDEYLMRFDGASRGNPGKATSASLLYKDENIIDTSAKRHDVILTNNQAEYIGCLLGVELAIKHNVKNLHIQGDSQLVMYQLIGTYKCKNKILQTYYNQLQTMLKTFETVKYTWIRRELNQDANNLCNKNFI